MIIAYRAKDRALFLYGFGKNERENIEPDELLSLREIAAAWLAADSAGIIRALEARTIQVINGDQED